MIHSVYNQSGQNVTGEIRKLELTQEILDTHLYRLGGRYTFEEDGDVLRVEFRSEKDTLMFTRTAHSISFHDPGNSRSDQTIYWVK